ncbi:HAD family hydrolase [Paraburkholderia tropica]|uniref:HAD family hydrolase n=1 Tax=Paraburkholderia tropica TaxID=92647 RepID=UPI003D2D8052
MQATPSGRLPQARFLICDCDGVLIDSEAIAERIIVERLEALWQRDDIADTVRPLLGMRTRPLLERVADTLGHVIHAETLASIDDAVRRGAVLAPVIEGVDAALGAIALGKACASNSNADYVSSALQRTGLIRHFADRVFTADQVAHPKPAPDVYLAAAHRVGVAPAHCLVVEDSVTGARAAVAAGMTVLGFAGAKHLPGDQIRKLLDAGASLVFERMTQLPSIVASIVDGHSHDSQRIAPHTHQDYA